MKKVCAYLSIVMLLTLGLSNVAFAQDQQATETETTVSSNTETAVEQSATVEEVAAPVEENPSEPYLSSTTFT